MYRDEAVNRGDKAVCRKTQHVSYLLKTKVKLGSVCCDVHTGVYVWTKKHISVREFPFRPLSSRFFSLRLDYLFIE